MSSTTRDGWLTPEQRTGTWLAVDGTAQLLVTKLITHAALADERIAELRETLDDMVEALRVLDYCHVNCKVMTGDEYRAQRFALARYDALGKKDA